MAEVGGNLVLEWRGRGLPLSAGMGCADAFTCPCGRPKIHGDRTSVAYSSIMIDVMFGACFWRKVFMNKQFVLRVTFKLVIRSQQQMFIPVADIYPSSY